LRARGSALSQTDIETDMCFGYATKLSLSLPHAHI
jgi:hypothetical protein